MNICSLFSPSLCWLLPMHGSFALMSGNFKCWNSWLGCILLLQQRVCCWYFGRKIYTEYHFLLMKPVLTLSLVSLGHYKLMQRSAYAWKVRRHSLAYNEYKRSFVLTFSPVFFSCFQFSLCLDLAKTFCLSSTAIDFFHSHSTTTGVIYENLKSLKTSVSTSIHWREMARSHFMIK